MIKRRTLLAGAGAATLVVVSGGAAAVRLFGGGEPSDGDDFVRLLAEVRDDYVNGRVVEHQGWVLSQHEFDTLASRAAG